MKYGLLRCCGVLGLAVMVLAVAGCPQPPYHEARAGITVDPKVREWLMYHKTVPKRTLGGQILVRSQFENRSREDLWADVQFRFYDADGMLVEKGDWRSVHFDPDSMTMIQGNSIGSNVVQYNIQIRNLRTRGPRILTGDAPLVERLSLKPPT